jgi:sulfotransferase family protein
LGFREWAARSFPDNAILHQHYRPSAELLSATDELGIQLVTTLRNPYDQFVSLYFYVQRFADAYREADDPAQAMIGQPLNAPAVLDFMRNGFGRYLEQGVGWLRSGRSVIVRYEALSSAPLETMIRVTDEIRPVERGVLEAALEDASAGRMRQISPDMQTHIRAATVGDWQKHLTRVHIAAMGAHRKLLAALGYGDGARPD